MAFNLLIVDDSNSMRTVVKKIVGLTGLETNQILEADNGRKALDVLGGNWVDAVILDINMPEMNGLELLQTDERGSPHEEHPRGDDDHGGQRGAHENRIRAGRERLHPQTLRTRGIEKDAPRGARLR